MKIGLVRRGFSPTGGAENYLLRLADALETAGHEPVLFSTAEWPRERWPAHREFVVVAASTPRAFADRVEQLSKRRCEKLFSLERVWRCDCYRAGDGVHRAWLQRRSQMEWPWEVWFRRVVNRKHRQILALEKSLFADGQAGKIVANSRMVRDEIIHWYETPPERIAVVYNGLPGGEFPLPAEADRAHARAALGLPEDDYAVLFAGTGWGRKGLPHALAAIDMLPSGVNERLLVAGRGNPKSFLPMASTRTRDRTRFLGPVCNMRALYAAADVFLAPTLYDPFSNACLEALASGLPVLTTQANGFAEIIEPGIEGEVVAPEWREGGEELAAALLKWADPARRNAARPVCAAKAARFTIEKNVADTLEILLDAT